MIQRYLLPFQQRHQRCHQRCLQLHQDFGGHLQGYLPQLCRLSLRLRQQPWCIFRHRHGQTVLLKKHPYRIRLLPELHLGRLLRLHHRKTQHLPHQATMRLVKFQVDLSHQLKVPLRHRHCRKLQEPLVDHRSWQPLLFCR